MKRFLPSELYVPKPARIVSRTMQTADTFLFSVVVEDGAQLGGFAYECGQFALLSVDGVGECPISLSSSPGVQRNLEFCIRAVGEVTSEICAMGEGGIIGIRGPLGRPFQLGEFEGRDLLFVAGGIGLAPLRSVIGLVLAERSRFGAVSIVYGARTPDDLCFRSELETWRRWASVHVTVDSATEGWGGHVGLVPDFVDELGLRSKDVTALVCGPPVMIRVELQRFEMAGCDPKRVWTTLERKMRCGVGKCARCLIGAKYVCVDGPVFNLAQLKEIPWEEE